MQKEIFKTSFKVVFLVIVILLFFSPLAYGENVHVISVEGTIDGGLAAYVERSFKEAEEDGVEHIIIEMDTPGGLIDSAVKIRETIKYSVVDTTTFVKGGAISAGVLIALTTDNIYMAPGTTIGDAEPRIGNDKADEKTVSYWTALLASAAEENGRDAEIAKAMADRDLEVPGIIEKDKLLTLTNNEALELDFIDGNTSNMKEVLAELELENAELKRVSMHVSERLTRTVTNPYVAPVLLTIGFIALAVELITVGFGAAGIVGIISFSLYFWGHVLAGFTGPWIVVLFIFGIILIILEVFVIPGFGIAGIGGLIALFASIVFAAGSLQQGLISLLVAVLGTIAAGYLSLKFGKTRKFWDMLVLSVKLDTESGYIPAENPLQELVGKKGITVTPLRPSGTIIVDGNRHDVVTEGDFIEKSTNVEIFKIDGNRIIVKRTEE